MPETGSILIVATVPRFAMPNAATECVLSTSRRLVSRAAGSFDQTHPAADCSIWRLPATLVASSALLASAVESRLHASTSAGGTDDVLRATKGVDASDRTTIPQAAIDTTRLIDMVFTG